jgi:hypothetical protein
MPLISWLTTNSIEPGKCRDVRFWYSSWAVMKMQRGRKHRSRNFSILYKVKINKFQRAAKNVRFMYNEEPEPGNKI